MRSPVLPLLAFALLNVAPAAAQPERPNIVLIFADDLGYGDLSSYGARDHETPRLDRMAAEGARLTNFYVPMPFCAPSRATILTGRYPFRNGVVDNPAPDGGNNETHLPLEEVTIAELLKPLGYASIAIGKWHLGHLPQWLPTRQGFDEYYGILYSNDMRPVQLVHNEEVVEYPVIQANLTKKYTRRALDFIEKNQDRPFFLYLPHAMPHKPLAASEDFYTPETPDDLYSDVLRELDWSVGQVLDKLEELDLDEKTLVIFTSDNGPWFGGSTSGLRGMKGLSWDGGIRTPMIARWPGVIPAGQVLGQVAATVDVFPTVAAVTGAEPAADRKLDGVDLTPLLTGEDTAEPHEAIVAMGGAQLRIVRSGKWKLHVRSPGAGTRYLRDVTGWIDPRGPDGVTLLAPYEQAKPNQYPGVLSGVEPKDMMLFDLEADPSEQYDVAEKHPEVVARLEAFFSKLEAEAPEPPSRRGRGGRGLLHLTGGALEYDREIQPKRPD